MRRGSFLSILTLLLLLFATLLSGCGSGKKGGAEAPIATPTVPGNLQSQITGVTINNAGQPVVTFTLRDQNGVPLDPVKDLLQKGGRARLFIAQLKVDGNYQNYILGTDGLPTYEQTAANFSSLGNGVFTYTFKTDITQTDLWKNTPNVQTLTHTVAGQFQRDIPLVNSKLSVTTFQQAVNPYFNFRPDGVTPVTQTREVVAISNCNECHDKLALHGGGRREIALCILCHNPGVNDPTTANTVDMKSMIHKIHYGEKLPSNVAGGDYTIGDTSFKTVAFPFFSGDSTITGTPIECVKCHRKGTDLAGKEYGANVDYWRRSHDATKSSASIENCTTCHDTTTFSGGTSTHTEGARIDLECNTCHSSGTVGSDEYNGTIVGAHTILEKSSVYTGINFQIISATNAVAGQTATVKFKITNNSGTSINPATGSFSLKIGYAATDYTNNLMVKYGQPLSQSLASGATANGDGSYGITFGTAIPATATGVGVIGLEGRINYTVSSLHKGTQSFSVGGSSVQYYFDLASGNQVANPSMQRRKSVDVNKCNLCHGRLSLHGANRVNSIEECVICHNPDATDASRRPAGAPTGTPDNLAEQPIDFKVMIHKIHSGENLSVTPYIIYGFGTPPTGLPGAPNDFSEVRYPQDRRNCLACHIDATPKTFGLPLSAYVLGTTIGSGTILNNDSDNTRITPMMSVCTSCHDDTTTVAHAAGNIIGGTETCAQCHSTGLALGPDFAHVPIR